MEWFSCNDVFVVLLLLMSNLNGFVVVGLYNYCKMQSEREGFTLSLRIVTHIYIYILIYALFSSCACNE